MKDREWRITGLTLGAGAIVYATWSVWRSNGSRPCLFICVATIVIALMDVTWAGFATRRTRVTVTANPSDVYVGDDVAVELDLQGPHRFVDVRLASFSPIDRRTAVEMPVREPFAGEALKREVLTEITVEVIGFGLAGLLSSLRRYTVPLARPLSIGPRPVPAAQPLPELFRAWGDNEPRPAPTGDVVRGVRPYLPGDPMRRIHWRATARTGDLVVKEVDETGAPRLTIALDMGGGGAAGERAAARAAWYALEGLRREYTVVLLTSERRKTVSGGVASRSDVIRRLAAATAPGAPDLSVDDQASGVLTVTDRGDSWR